MESLNTVGPVEVTAVGELQKTPTHISFILSHREEKLTLHNTAGPLNAKIATFSCLFVISPLFFEKRNMSGSQCEITGRRHHQKSLDIELVRCPLGTVQW